MNLARKLLLAGLLGGAGLAILGTVAVAAAYLVVAPGLPSIEALRDIRLQVPMRVYSHDGRLIAEFGEMRRMPVRFAETPDLMVKAVLAAEDDRFFQHPGVDYQGILRAAVNLIRTGEKSQGGSTITMQVARNFFLSSEKTYLRKVSEIFLALRIEHELSKEDILELYLNKIYLGNRAYGVASAAQTYYGTELGSLTLDQMAMIAGLPKAPSRSNPIADPERAVIRRNYVLRRMHELGYITADARDQAMAQSDSARLHGLAIEIEGNYLAEMARTLVVERYGEQLAYSGGLKVYTTLEPRLQQAAVAALRESLLEYDRRHGYRGPERRVAAAEMQDEAQMRALLARYPEVGGLPVALVTAVTERETDVMFADGARGQIPWDGLSWARRYIDSNRRGPPPTAATDILAPGDVIRVSRTPQGLRLAQLPDAESALVAMRPHDGAVTALAGGFDFQRSHFNRVTQALRQPGSSFKPFIYSAALDKDYTPASLINDAPVVFDDPALESTWRPGNYSGEFFGPTRLRVALMNSRNLVSIRLLSAIGIGYAVDYAARFGFDARALPRDLSLALGSGAVTPLQLAAGYAVFANGGYRVAPYFIEEIRDGDDRVIYRAAPAVVCTVCDDDPALRQAVLDSSAAARAQAVADGVAEPLGTPGLAERVISPQNAYLMNSMMRDVITGGTAVRARQLGRGDLAGKTGTTNDLHDAWFAGYNDELVAITWMGFDQPRSLGNGETGSRAALPMWIHFMREALRGVEEHPLTRPPGLVTVRIDPETGLLASSNQQNGIFETFPAALVPSRHATGQQVSEGNTEGRTGGGVSEQLF